MAFLVLMLFITVKNKGLRGLYSGFTPFVIQSSGKAAVRFYAYDVFAGWLSASGFSREENPTAFSVICGMAAGTCEAVFWTCPTERMKVLNQSNIGEPILLQNKVCNLSGTYFLQSNW